MMKCIIINNGDEQEYKVKRMNYNQVMVLVGKDVKVFSIDEVKLIPEGEIDELLIDKKDLLKVKLKRGMSVFVYGSIYSTLKEKYDEDIEEINVLKDKYELLNKRGYWQKKILMVVNKRYPIKFEITGRNFKQEGYEIDIYEYTKKEFLSICDEEIKNIENDILKRNKILSMYGKAILDIKEKDVLADNSVPLISQ